MAKVVSNKKQLTRLVELMEKNIDIAKGLCAKPLVQKRWDEFATELNKLGPPTREWHKWLRVWVDLKCKTKKKVTEKKMRNFNNLDETISKMLDMETSVNQLGIECSSEDTILIEDEEKPSMKKFKTESEPTDEHFAMVTPTHIIPEPETDNFQKMADVWASKLRQMSPSQQLYAERFINEILFEGIFGNLHRDSIQITS